MRSCHALPGRSVAVAVCTTKNITFTSARPLHPATPNDDLSSSATNSAISAITCSGFKIADLATGTLHGHRRQHWRRRFIAVTQFAAKGVITPAIQRAVTIQSTGKILTDRCDRVFGCSRHVDRDRLTGAGIAAVARRRNGRVNTQLAVFIVPSALYRASTECKASVVFPCRKVGD